MLLEAIGAQIAAGALSLIGAESLRPVRDQLLASSDAEGTERLLLTLGWKRRATTPVILRFQMGRGWGASDEVRSRDLLVETMTEPGRRLEAARGRRPLRRALGDPGPRGAGTPGRSPHRVGPAIGRSPHGGRWSDHLVST